MPRRPSSRTPFILFVLGLLGGGLVCLLVINTMLAAGAYQINSLQQTETTQAQQVQVLQQQVAADSAPSVIARRARQLGMVAPPLTNFLNLRTGRIISQPTTQPGVPRRARIRPVTEAGGRAGRPARPRAGGRPPAPAGRAARPPPGGAPGRGRRRARPAERRRTGLAASERPRRDRRRPAGRGGPRRRGPRSARAGTGGRGRARRRRADAQPGGADRGAKQRSCAAGRRRSPRAAGRPRRPALRRGNPGRRLRVTMLCLGFVLSLVAGRLVQLQAMQGHVPRPPPRLPAEHRSPSPAVRGSITTADGTTLAMTVQTDLVYADPPMITRGPAVAGSVAAALAGPLGMTSRRDPGPAGEPDVRRVRGAQAERPGATADQITALNLPGVARRRLTPGPTRTATWPPTSSASPPATARVT